MPPFLVQASYGGVSFWLASLQGKGGRDVVVQSPSRGDQHVLQDRGLRHRTAQCELLFVDEPGKASPVVRFREFQKLVSDDDPQIFRHPLEGSYLARVADFEYKVNGDDHEITASCTFLADGEPIVVLTPGLGSLPLAGRDEVAATVAATNDELAAQGLASDVPAGTLARVEAWTQAETPNTRAIYLEAESLRLEIAAETERLQLLADIERWPLYREFLLLGYQARRAAESVASETAAVVDLLVRESAPLRLLCAQLYGAADAEDKARQVQTLNALRTPGLVPAGTTLKVPREGAR